MRREHHVFEFEIAFRYPYADVARRDTGRIVKSFRCSARPAKHRRYSVSFILVSTETEQQLVQRIGAVLDTIESIEDYTCTRLLGAEGKHGEMCPLHTRVREALAEASRRDKPQYYGQRRPRDSGIKHGLKKFDKGTSL